MRVFVRTAKNMKFNKLRYSPYLAEGQFRKPSGPLWSSTLYPPKWLVPPWLWCRSLLLAGRSSDPYWGVCLDALKSKEPGQQPPEKNAFQTSGQVLRSIQLTKIRPYFDIFPEVYFDDSLPLRVESPKVGLNTEFFRSSLTASSPLFLLKVDFSSGSSI